MLRAERNSESQLAADRSPAGFPSDHIPSSISGEHVHPPGHVFGDSDRCDARRALFLVPATFEALSAKGVADMILERDENGFFEHVYTAHFPAPRSQVLTPSSRHTVLEVGPEPLDRLKGPGVLRKGFYLLKILWVLYRLVRKERVTLIRATEPCLRGFLALLLGRVSRIPWCVSLHADYDVRFRLAGPLEAPVLFGSRAFARKVERFVLTRAPLIMPIRESLKEYVLRLGISMDRVRIIPHGIDLTPFSQLADPNFTARHGFGGKALVVFAGRLSRDNYAHDIPQIARLVLEWRDDVVFALLGDGRERPVLEQTIRELGLDGKVLLLGFQPRRTVVDFRVNAGVNLCLMGGYSLIEAAASGRPVVAYDVEWHSELIRNGESGLLVREGDVDAAAEAILTLLESSEMASRLGGTARRMALHSYSLEASRANKIACYRELLQQFTRRP